jgi:hypothetical protein
VLGVKVCPHCAEELPDEATVCPECHKDPAKPPAWAVPRRPDAPPPWWSEDALEPTGSDGVPAPYKRLEPAVAREGSLSIPSKVWVSLILSWVGGPIAAMTAALLPWGVGLIFRAVAYIAGLILGNLGRAEVKASDRLGQVIAIVAIVWNAIGLFSIVVGVLESGLALRG